MDTSEDSLSTHSDCRAQQSDGGLGLSKIVRGENKERLFSLVSPHFSFRINFLPALYYLNTWNRLQWRLHYWSILPFKLTAKIHKCTCSTTTCSTPQIEWGRGQSPFLLIQKRFCKQEMISCTSMFKANKMNPSNKLMLLEEWCLSQILYCSKKFNSNFFPWLSTSLLTFKTESTRKLSNFNFQ